MDARVNISRAIAFFASAQQPNYDTPFGLRLLALLK
jgi:hypothetical protein